MLTPLTVILVLVVLRYTVLLALLHSGVYPTRYMLTLLYPPGWSHVTDIDGDFIECTAESDVTFSGTVNKLQEFENYSAEYGITNIPSKRRATGLLETDGKSMNARTVNV